MTEKFDFKTIYHQLISEDRDLRLDAVDKLYVQYHIKLKRYLQYKYPHMNDSIEDIVQISFFKIIEKKISPKNEIAIVGWLHTIAELTASDEAKRFWRKAEVSENSPLTDNMSKMQQKYEQCTSELKRLNDLPKISKKNKIQISRLKVQITGILNSLKKMPKVDELSMKIKSGSLYSNECMHEATVLFGIQYPEEASILNAYRVGVSSLDKKPTKKNLEEIAIIYQKSVSNIKKIVTNYSKKWQETLTECLEN